MITCSICQHINRDGAQYCNKCGAVLAPNAYTSLQAGQRLQGGKYVVLRTLGKGGMGVVYLAEQAMAGATREVVVKEMLDYFDPTDPHQAQQAKERFQEEAATLLTLNHTSIPQIFDYFSEDGRNYIVMQHIHGESLDRRVSRSDDAGNTISGQVQPPITVARWGVQMCSVLEYLVNRTDSAGNPRPVIHHDIKPANLIINQDSGGVYLVDFGTARARLISQSGGGVGMVKSSIYGTIGYAPPEQHEGKSEARSDVYALAATLYHLATDDAPAAHPFQFPQLDKLPTGMAAALKPALAQSVAQRTTAAEFRTGLEKYLQFSNKSQKSGSRIILATVLIALILGLSGIVYATVFSPNGSTSPATAGLPINTPTIEVAAGSSPETPSVTPTSTLRPSATPTAARTLQATATPLIVATLSPEPESTMTPTAIVTRPKPSSTSTVAPTPRPPSATLPPVLQLSAPTLLAPGNEQRFDGPASLIQLSWQPMSLPAGSCYVVSIRFEHGSDIWTDVHCLTETHMALPEYLGDNSTGTRFEWYVTIMRPQIDKFIKEADGIPLSPSSVRQIFYWSPPGDSGESGPKPTPTRP